ncbi:DUF2569 family protein [Providencia rustigianii]|uniref:Protein of uncharacterized function (DUF2569) n=1 Tax=Providencia rustigianii TaxID=158850 RepID=A0A379FZH8_9GAMM|nr:DUF2569 family protein [Providencia rustigianii]SUC34097.1 Protein of uncharacterised function (DUF2569) [Providencia rustigianii]
MEVNSSSSGEPSPVSYSTLKNELKVQPRGIGGWLILPLLGQLYMLCNLISMMLQDITLVKGVWSLATDSDSDFYIAGFAPTFYSVQAGLGVVIALMLWSFIAAFKGKSSTKLLFIITMLLYVFIIAIARIAFPLAFDLEIDFNYVMSLFYASLYCLIGIVYFLVSVRVKNTFIH